MRGDVDITPDRRTEPGLAVVDVAAGSVPGEYPSSAWAVSAREMADAIWLVHQQQRHGGVAAGGRSAGSGTPSATGAAAPSSAPIADVPSDSPRQSSATTPDPAATPESPEHVDMSVRSVTSPAGSGGYHLAVPLPPVDREIPRALRPLRQTMSSTHDQVLDEIATAERALVDRRWLPVVEAAEERRWDVVLVVDDGPSMALWRSTVAKFVAVLERQGAFRNVHIRLFSDDGDDGRIVLRTAAGAPRHSISDLFDPTDRRVVLVLTDGACAAWRSGAASEALCGWGRSLPIAVVHLLPWSMWWTTGFRTHRLRFRAHDGGAANRRLAWHAQASLVDPLYDDVRDAVPIPILGLGARWLGPWSRLVTGTASGWTDLPAILCGPAVVDPAPDIERPVKPAALVAAARAAVTPETFELAKYLAAAPLTLDVMLGVQQSLLPMSNVANLSEFLASGLVEPIRAPEMNATSVVFEFRFGVREELLAAGRRGTTAFVMRLVERLMAPGVPEARGFGYTLDREPVESADRTVTKFGQFLMSIEAAALGAMSGSHLAAARDLRRKLVAVGAGPDPGRPARHTGAIESTTTDDSSTLGYGPGMTSGVDPNTGRVGASVSGWRSGIRESRARAEVPPVVIRGGVPPRNPHFTGRADLLRQLHERLVPGATAAVLPQTLHGLGGVGKSQLAVEYAYRHGEDYDIIWWIPAEHPVQIQSALVELGERLDLGVGREVNVAVGVVLDALRGSTGGHTISPNWLLVYDNAEDPEAVMNFLPTGGPGRILVTSRNSQWHNLARPLEVDVFQRWESIELLRRREPDLTDRDADALADALGDLPLAIEQAAAWRAETGMPAEEYIELLIDKQAEILSLQRPLDYPKPVAAAWNLSLDNLLANNPTALQILQLCAFVAPEPIPRTMFTARGVSVTPDLDYALRDRVRLNQAIRDINRYALARIDHRTNSIQMHRLVQAVLIGRMTEEQQQVMRHGAHLLLAANTPRQPDDPMEWDKYSQLYPHITASNAIQCEDQDVRELLYNTAKFLYFWGEFQTSRNLSQQIYDVLVENVGADHVHTLRVGRWLGFMLWVAGDYQKAAEFNDRLLGTHRRVLGDAHEDTIDAYVSVAGDRRARGDFTSALELSRTIYEQCVRQFGDAEPLTLNAAHNLSVSLRLSGLFTEARDLDERTWRQKTETFGADHPLSLLTQVGLALDLRELGDWREAGVVHEEIVAKYRGAHGDLHTHTLHAIRIQAGMRHKAGDYAGATAAADEAFAGLSRRYGLDHPETMAAALSRAINLRQSSDLEAAHQVATDLVQRYRRTLGDGHPHTLSGCSCLAIICRLRSRPDEARALNEEALRGLTDRFGADHPATIVAAVNLASDLLVLGEVQAAYDQDMVTTARLERVMGPDHPTTLAGKVNLAQDLRVLGRLAEASSLRADIVARTAARLGASHPAVEEFSNPYLRANCDIDPMPL